MKKELILTATDIDWDISLLDALSYLDGMSYRAAAEALEIPTEMYANMTTQERHDYAYDCWERNKDRRTEFMGAPSSMVIPEPENPNWDIYAIADYISEVSGWCTNGFGISCSWSKDEL